MKKIFLLLTIITSMFIFIPTQTAYALTTADLNKVNYKDWTTEYDEYFILNNNIGTWYWDSIIKSTNISDDTLIYVPLRNSTYFTNLEFTIETDIQDYYSIDLLDSANDKYFIKGYYFSINKYMYDLSQDGQPYFSDEEITITLDFTMNTAHSANYYHLSRSLHVITAGINSPFYNILIQDITTGPTYADGYQAGKTDGILEGRLQIFNYGSAYYGFVDSASFDYRKAYYGNYENLQALTDAITLNIYENGIAMYTQPNSGDKYISQSSYDYNLALIEDPEGAYQQGYLDGSNNSFQANLHVWIVPAIIIVLIGGGFVTFALRKRE